MKFLTILLCFAALTASSQNVPKQRYDALQKQYNDLKKENQQLKAEIRKPSKFSVSYKIGYTPNGGDLALNNFNHDFSVGYDLSGLKLNLGLLYDWKISQSSIYAGSDMVLITNAKAKFLTVGGIGSNVGEDKTAFVNFGLGLRYSVSKHVSCESQIRWNHYSTQNPVTTINAGILYHL